MKIAVLGMGSWGSALSRVLSDNQHLVKIWTIDEKQAEEWNERHTNHRYLPDASMPDDVIAVTDLNEALKEAEMIVVVIPTKAIRSVMDQVANCHTDDEEIPLIVHASKGIDTESHMRISELIEETLKDKHYQGIVALSGPSHAEEVIRRELTTITAASTKKEFAETVQEAFMTPYFRVYTNSDLIGVELGGALKNIIAIGAGILDGLGFGDNAKAALITRGLAEMTRLGVALGADPLTFSGLSGIGDLIVTCNSVHSRNYQAGKLLAQGHDKQSLEDEIGMVVEGILTCQAANELAEKHQIEMPITQGLYQLIYQDAELTLGIKALMGREGKSEARTIDHLFNLKGW